MYTLVFAGFVFCVAFIAAAMLFVRAVWVPSEERVSAFVLSFVALLISTAFFHDKLQKFDERQEAVRRLDKFQFAR